MNPPHPQHGPLDPTSAIGAGKYEDVPSLTDVGIKPQRGTRSESTASHSRPTAHAVDDANHHALSHRARSAERSDSLIAEELGERMRNDELLDASEILVGCTDGRVLLTGEVPERSMKHLAEHIAEAVHGIRDIENHIRVSKAGESFGVGGAVRTAGPAGSGFSSPSD